MLVLRIIVGTLALVEVTSVLLSVLRSVVTRDRVLALQAPLGLFAQLLLWALLIYVGFAALFWAVGDTAGGAPLARIIELSGSSMLTLGFDTPRGVLSAETVLDGGALLMSSCDVPRQSRSELCVEAGERALVAIADFLGVPHRPPPVDGRHPAPQSAAVPPRPGLNHGVVRVTEELDASPPGGPSFRS